MRQCILSEPIYKMFHPLNWLKDWDLRGIRNETISSIKGTYAFLKVNTEVIINVNTLYFVFENIKCVLL